MIKGETAWRGGAGGEDYHHGQVILGRQPHKNQFGGQHPEFPQPQLIRNLLCTSQTEVCGFFTPHQKFGGENTRVVGT